MFIRHNGKTYSISNNKKQEYKGFIEGLKFVLDPDYTDDYNRALTWWLESNKEEDKENIFKRFLNYFID